MIRICLRSIVAGALLVGVSAALPSQRAAAQPAPSAPMPIAQARTVAPATTTLAPDGTMQISWEVRNRFRLFREERDFLLHTESARGRSVLASEQALELQSDGRGWARNTVNRLCIDLQGRVSEPCTRDNVRESYLTPIDHPVTVRLAGEVPVGATCAWSFDDGDGPQASTFDCAEPINLRVRYGRATVATVDVSAGPAAPQRISTEIMVRDLLIAGIGDSIASGEGNPDRAIALSDEGFCFRNYLSGASAQYYRPSRAGFKGGRACEAPDTLQNWQRNSALWLNSACHRSLYSYQTRTALALAVQYPHIAVTYLPLACTGATIPDGLLGPQRARECLPTKSGNNCQGTVNGQLSELRAALAAAKKRQPDRKLDLILLSIGANDINFSGLVADVIVDTPTERVLFRHSGVMGTVDDSRAALTRDLPQSFVRLREALKSLTGGDLSHVVYVSYANPALADGGAPCPGGRAGFDIHPSFAGRIPAAVEGARDLPVGRAVPRPRFRPHDLRRCPSGGVRRSRILRARPERSRIRPDLFFGHRRQFRSGPRQRGEPADAVRPRRLRIPRLSPPRALDPRRQRQLLRGHDLSAGVAVLQPAQRHP